MPAPMGYEGEYVYLTESTQGHVTVLFPSKSFSWVEASEFISATLKASVFAFRIFDGDFWMYLLFSDGELVDQFNPIPDYEEEELTDEEIALWRGDPQIVARYWPNVQAEDIENYLVRWELDRDLNHSERSKAYPDDQYHFNDEFQVMDFMKKLGLAYPYRSRMTVSDTTQPDAEQRLIKSFRFE